LLVEDWSFGAKRYRGTKITLAKGQKVPVVAEFHQGGQDRYFRLGWHTPTELRVLANRVKTLNNALETYLPAGATWFDFWTGERLSGGQSVTKDCPLDAFPLYVRAGSIVAMGPADLQYATERPDAPYEIRVYSGANATFTIYEDDNETYAYEKGQRATYDLTWNDAAKTLTIGARQGTFPGMVAKRQLNIALFGGNTERASKTVTYSGQALEITFR
jgi:alpha-D-xyloside xylohydrolase